MTCYFSSTPEEFTIVLKNDRNNTDAID